MKKMIIAAFAVAAVAGCMKQENAVENEGTPITVKAGFSVTAETKAMNADGSAFAKGNDDFRICAYGGSDLESSVLYDNIFDHQVDWNAMDSKYHLTPGKFYPVNGDNLYFYAFWPQSASQENTGTRASAAATFTLDGNQDIIYAKDETGYSKTGDGQPNLQFSHKMTCIEFYVIAGEGFAEDAILNSISVLGQPNSAKMTISNGTIAYTGSAAYSKSNLNVSIPASDEEAVKAATMFISPNQSDNKFSISVVAGDNTFNNVEVGLVPNDGTLEGVKYKVTLTFKAKEIIPTATILPWAPGEDVDVDIQ